MDESGTHEAFTFMRQSLGRCPARGVVGPAWAIRIRALAVERVGDGFLVTGYPV